MLYAASIVDLNVPSNNFMNGKYNLQYTPTTFFDGGHGVFVGGSSDTSDYTGYIRAAGARASHDLYLSVSLTYISSTKLDITVKVASRELTNTAPDGAELPWGVTNVPINQTAFYTTRATDLDGDNVYLRWAFGDGDSSQWLGPYASGDTCQVGHAWATGGTHQVTVLSRDKWQESHGWSDGLLVTACNCGDADNNNTINISDVVYVIGFVFNSTPIPADCGYTFALGDADGNAVVNISDVVALIGYVFNSTPIPHCSSM